MRPQITLPHSEEAERAVLATVLLTPEVLDDLELQASDFYLERHQLLFESYRSLAADSQPIDLRTVQAWLEQRQRLEHAGGIAYLAILDVDLPDVSRVESYATIVRDRALRRRLLALGQRLQSEIAGGELAAGEITARLYRELEELDQAGSGGAGASGSDLLPALLSEIDRRRAERQRTGEAVLGIKTSLPSLDELLGGLQTGLYLLAGPPGVGKTSLALQIALQAAREAPVVYVSFENGSDQLLLKVLASRANLDSQEVLRGLVDVEPLVRAGEELRPVLDCFFLLDGDSRLTTHKLRALARRILERSRAKRCLLVLDYLQLMAKMSHELRGLTDTRAKVDTLGGELIALAKRLASPILALSSQSRSGGNYGRGGGQAKLDSLKESGDLEYSADVAMFLTEDEDGGVPPPGRALDLTVKKNRHGPIDSVPLVYLPDRGVLREEASWREPEGSGS